MGVSRSCNNVQTERPIIKYIWQVFPSHNISLLQDVFLSNFGGLCTQLVARLLDLIDIETETYRDFRILRMSRPRLNETQEFGGCRDRDSSRLKNLEDVETETDRDSPKGVETETETESLATHCPLRTLTLSPKGGGGLRGSE